MFKKILLGSALVTGIFMYMNARKKHNAQMDENIDARSCELVLGEENV